MALDDELLNRVTWKIPNALALVGSRSGDERNAMTTSWITQLSMEPVLIGIGVDTTGSTPMPVNSANRPLALRDNTQPWSPIEDLTQQKP